MSQYKFRESKTVKPEEIKTSSAFIEVNSLEEKRKYIYFRRGRIGTANYQCGRRKYKVKKKGLKWTYIGTGCDNNVDLYRIEKA